MTSRRILQIIIQLTVRAPSHLRLPSPLLAVQGSAVWLLPGSSRQRRSGALGQSKEHRSTNSASPCTGRRGRTYGRARSYSLACHSKPVGRSSCSQRGSCPGLSPSFNRRALCSRFVFVDPVPRYLAECNKDRVFVPL